MSTFAASVTRTALSLADLNLFNPGSYEVEPPTGPGQVTWRRQYATSPYVEGSSLVTAVRDQVSSTLVVRCFGASASALETNTAALIAAFSQFSYTLTLTWDGVSHVWACDPADYQPIGGLYDDMHFVAFQQAYQFTIPRSPVTSSST